MRACVHVCVSVPGVRVPSRVRVRAFIRGCVCMVVRVVTMRVRA
jgi:hypothetical protein